MISNVKVTHETVTSHYQYHTQRHKHVKIFYFFKIKNKKFKKLKTDK